MKSYLSLIPISARVRRKQSRMIILCIVLAVFLVTAIFSLVEASVKMETNFSVDKNGYWHIYVKGIQENEAQEIAGRADVAASSWYDVLNLDDDLNMDKDYYIGGAQTALCGIDEQFIGDIMHFFSEGSHIVDGNEVILTENAKELLGVEIGDTITLNMPAGSRDFVITGFRISGNGKYVSASGDSGVTTALLVKNDRVGAFINIDTFREICAENGEIGNPRYYIQFQKRTNLKKAMEEIKAQYGLADDDIGLNTVLMAASGISNKDYIKNVYPTAGVLFVLILAAGVLMISGSMNSNVAQRLQFFGMLRCVGASRSQIIRFVRLEALYWCKSAVPMGVAAGVVITWIVCAGLKYIVGGEFIDMSIFVVSATGILCGVVIGVVTVFLAAQAPAKRAAKVSPVAAVSGNAGDTKNIKHVVNAGSGKVETALGIHHAVAAKKNLLLMTGSFALSIILFLCFSVLIELIGCLLPQKASAPDLDITSVGLDNDIDAAFAEEIEQIAGVAHVLPRSMCKDIPAAYQDKSSSLEKEIVTNVELISYSDHQLELLIQDDDLRKGSDLTTVYGDGNGVLVIWDRDIPWEIGDKLRIADEELEIAGMLKYNPFTNDGSSGGVVDIVTSQETFTRLTGISNYVILDVQLEKRSGEESDETVAQIQRLCDAYDFRDRREERSIAGEFYALMVFGYGFVAIIALISLLNIMNSISMSVSARINQYGAMRAIGMSISQITKMIATEAFTYAAAGCIVGFVIGLPLSKWMYDVLITSHFYYFTWSLPVAQIMIVVLFILISAFAAVYAPSKRIREMAITETINEL